MSFGFGRTADSKVCLQTVTFLSRGRCYADDGQPDAGLCASLALDPPLCVCVCRRHIEAIKMIREEDL